MRMPVPFKTAVLDLIYSIWETKELKSPSIIELIFHELKLGITKKAVTPKIATTTIISKKLTPFCLPKLRLFSIN
jgi:hypothetical protein